MRDAYMRVWQVSLAGAAVLIGCGIFLALQDLGTATNWASVGSFFLALVTGIGSVLSFLSAKSKKEASAHRGNNQVRGRGTFINVGNQMVVNGDHSHVEATFGEPPSQSKRQRKSRPTARR
jgi:hypothetical protein